MKGDVYVCVYTRARVHVHVGVLEVKERVCVKLSVKVCEVQQGVERIHEGRASRRSLSRSAAVLPNCPVDLFRLLTRFGVSGPHNQGDERSRGGRVAVDRG